MCSRVGYSVYSPATVEENIELHNESLQFTNTCSSNYHLWIGATDEAEEGEWRKFSDDTVVQPIFELPEPNGGDGENCVLMFLPNGLWVDTSCAIQWPACVPCQADHDTPLRLRGFCFAQEPHAYYEVLGYRGGKPYFHGYYGTMIFSVGDGIWLIFDTTQNKQIATLTLAHESLYPIGRHVWTMRSSQCNHLDNTKLQLSFSVCRNSEFTCSNGDCIPKEGLCDAIDDCLDLSDEDDCEMIRLPNGYKNQRPPSSNNPKVKRQYRKQKPEITQKPEEEQREALELSTHLEILRFMDINDIRRHVNMELLVQITWTDPRPKYLNLRDTLELNRLSPHDKHKLWIPRLHFPNVLNGDIDLLDEELFVEKVGNSQPADFNDEKMGKSLWNDVIMQSF